MFCASPAQTFKTQRGQDLACGATNRNCTAMGLSLVKKELKTVSDLG